MPLFNSALKSGFQTMWSAISDVFAGTTTLEQSLMTATASGSRVILANTLQPNTTIRIIINGVYDAATLPGTCTIKVKIGGVVVAQGAANQLLSLAGALGFTVRATMQVRASGAAGKLQAAGTFEHGIAAQGRAFLDLNSVADATFDTTIDNQLDVTATWSLTGSKLTAKTGTVELLTT